MDDIHAEQFRKKQIEFDREVQRYAESDSIGSVVEQLALAKALCSELVRNATTPAQRQQIMPAVRDCLKVVNSLSSSYAEMQIRSGQMIHRSVLDKFASTLTGLFCEVCQRHGVPNYELLVDEITERLEECFPKPEPKKHAKSV